MNNYIWARSYWAFFHILSNSLNSNKLQNTKILYGIRKLIYVLIANIPCHTCKEDSIEYLNNSNLNNITTKNDFVIFFFNFHNYVNRKLRKKPFLFHNIYIYSNQNIETHLNTINKYIFKNRMNHLIYKFSKFITT
jgi:hypothetical protein